MRTSRAAVRSAPIPLLAIAIAACAGSLEDRDGFIRALQQSGDAGGCDVPSVFSASCAVSGCHTTAAKTGGLDLEAPDPFSRLVGQKATGGNGVIIDSGGDPNKSILYLKLKSPPPYGAQMPMTGPKLDDQAVSCIGEWITEQAKLLDAGSPDTGTAPGFDSGTNGGMDGGGGGGDDGGGAVDTGAGGPPDGGTAAGGATFTQVYAIFQGNCLPCHATGDGNNMGMLDLSSQSTAYTNLVGVKAAGSQCGSSGETRVVAGNSAMSLLSQIINPNPPCGSQMPSNGPPLIPADIATIGAWIDQGAPNN